MEPLTEIKKNGQRAVEENPIGLPKAKTDQIIQVLDVHVSSLFVLFHQYQKHHWLVEGPHFRDLHLYLEESYQQIHQDLDALAERITMLGGIPTSAPSAMADLAYITHEKEGQFSVRQMLRNDLVGEQAVIHHLRKTISMTLKMGDYGTERLLKKLLYHAEDRAHHLDHYLQEATLVSVN